VSAPAGTNAFTHLRRAVSTALLLCAWPGAVSAHLAQTGLGPFYDGVAHLFVSPEQLSSLLALTLLAGLGGRAHGRAALWVLLVAWSVGGVLGLLTIPGLAHGLGASEGIAAAALLLSGGLTAWDPELTVRKLVLLTAVLGLIGGAFSGIGIAGAGMGWSGLAGTLVAVAVVATLAVALAITMAARPLGRRIVRVAGSWLAASGLLWLGWSLR
jgi:hydrogenase/urease accessory protein HupE